MVPSFAVAKGANIIEKHFTLNKKDSGPDHSTSLEPSEFLKMINYINIAHKANGKTIKNLHNTEKKFSRRKGIYFNKNLSKGSSIKLNDITIKSPPLGLMVKDIELIIERKLIKSVKKNEPIKKEFFN